MAGVRIMTPQLAMSQLLLIRHMFWLYEESPAQGFDTLVESRVDVVGVREESAKGHFRHAGVVIKEYDWMLYSLHVLRLVEQAP